MLDFCRENPDGKETAGKKRGANLNLNRYVNRIYAQMSSARVEDDVMWDQELFVNKMQGLRGWSQEYAQSMFQQLENNPSVFKDQEGLGGTVRVAVPPNWTGEDRRQRKREVGESRMVERSAKTSKIADADVGKVVDELDHGFRFRDNASLNAASSSWTAPTSAASITNMDSEGGATAVQLVTNVAKKVGPGTEAAESSSPAAGEASSPSQAQTAPGKPDSEKRVAKFDIERLKTSRTMDALMRDHAKKLEEHLKRAWAAVLASEASADEDLLSLIKERALIAIHWLGALPVVVLAPNADASTLVMTKLPYDEEDSCYLGRVQTLGFLASRV